MTADPPETASPSLGPTAGHLRASSEWLVVAVLAAALVVGLIAGQWTTRADNLVYDALSKWAIHAPRDEIVIVGIDDRSISEVGRWPWPRARHAELLQHLAEARPKAVAYDVLFLEPDRQAGEDEALAKALKAASPTYLPVTFNVPGANGAPYDVALPIPPALQATAGLGHVNVAFDQDGIVRRAFRGVGDGDRRWPHLMQRLQRAAHDAASPPVATGRPSLGGLTQSDPVAIAFAGPAGTYRTISAVDLLRGETPPEFLRDKLVLVGATADGLGDRYATPLSAGEAMSGVELQANLLDTLISGRSIAPLPTTPLILLSLAPLALLLAAFLKLPPRANMILGLLLIGAAVAASAALFLGARIWASPVPALAGLLLAYPLWSWRRLEASSAYMLGELQQFAQERDLWPTAPADGKPPTSDPVARRAALLHLAIGRARDARMLVTDSLQGLPDAVLVVSLDKRVVFANREAEALFASLGTTPTTGASLANLLVHFQEGPPAGDTRDRQMVLADGRSFNLRATPLGNARRQVVGHVLRFTDITALKAAGEEREQVLQLLTHDMRSPQVSILTLLRQQAPDALSSELGDKIAGYAQRTLKLADNFVHLARAEQSILTMEVVDLGALVLDAVDDLWPQAKARGVVVETEGCEEEWLIRADRSLVTRALINLQHNAIKFTEPGGRVVWRLERDPAESGEIVCTISDTGRGMSEPQRLRLFERFARAPGRSDAEADGAGLGLSFVHAVISRHAGTIACESRLDQGTTFTIRFPMHAEDADATPEV